MQALSMCLQRPRASQPYVSCSFSPCSLSLSPSLSPGDKEGEKGEGGRESEDAAAQGWAEGDGDPLNGDGRTARGQVPPLPFDFYSVPSHAAELLVSPNGRFVFVTNRGHDSITVFTVGDGNLVRARTHCEPPRTGPR